MLLAPFNFEQIGSGGSGHKGPDSFESRIARAKRGGYILSSLGGKTRIRESRKKGRSANRESWLCRRRVGRGRGRQRYSVSSDNPGVRKRDLPSRQNAIREHRGISIGIISGWTMKLERKTFKAERKAERRSCGGDVALMF